MSTDPAVKVSDRSYFRTLEVASISLPPRKLRGQPQGCDRSMRTRIIDQTTCRTVDSPGPRKENKFCVTRENGRTMIDHFFYPRKDICNAAPWIERPGRRRTSKAHRLHYIHRLSARFPEEVLGCQVLLPQDPAPHGRRYVDLHRGAGAHKLGNDVVGRVDAGLR
jgi:hypothetical protein